MKVRQITTAILGLGITALALSSCSSGSGSGSATTSGGSGSGQTIEVGTIGSYSGLDASTYGGVPLAFDAWADSVNASGGIGGRKVKVINEDIGTTTGAGLVAAKTLINTDHVVAIIGDVDPAGPTWVPWVASQNVPVFSMEVSSVGNPDIFQVVPPEFTMGYGVQEVAKQYGNKLGSIYCDEVPACKTVAAFDGAFHSYLGNSLAVQLAVSSSAPSYTAQCESLKDAGVSSYTVIASDAVVKTVVDDCYQAGYKAPVIEAGSSDPSWTSDPAFSNAQLITQFDGEPATSTSAESAFLTAVQKYEPSLANAPEENNNALGAWVSGKLFEAALSNAGSAAVTAASVKQGLYGLPQGETLGGLSAPLHFVQGQQGFADCFFKETISGGQFVMTSDQPTCAPASQINAVAPAAEQSSGYGG